MSGSLRAMTWFFFTIELKSTRRSLIWPDTWLPTCTVMTALRLPVGETAAVRGPRSTRAVRNLGTLPRLWA
jgi:hypothetical protein